MGLLDKIGFAFAKQWIAGRTIDEAIHRAKLANADNEKVILNYLGEAYGRERDVRRGLQTYMNLLDTMKRTCVDGSISVKPTQLGMLEGSSELLRNFNVISSKAEKLGIFVWVDMEEYQYIDRTITAYLGMLKRHSQTGICLQAKLKRSIGDAKAVMQKGGSVRIVKGAYREPQGRAYTERDAVRRNFISMLKLCMGYKGAVMVATHDDYIISAAATLGRKSGKRLQFAMLNGIRPSLARRLAESGEHVSIYMPFGKEWADYALRRLREEGHAALLLRSVFQK